MVLHRGLEQAGRGFVGIRRVFKALRATTLGLVAGFAALGGTVAASPFTSTTPSGIALPDVYPEAGGIAMVMVGANGNIYYQFSDPDGAFRGYQYSGFPREYRGNPFEINAPLSIDCGLQSCSDYFGGAILSLEVRFTAYDGDTQSGGFDEDDIFLRMNGYTIGNWSNIETQATNTSGTNVISQQFGFGNNTFDTGWFTSTNPALLNNILTTGRTNTRVFDSDPNDNYWDFRRGNSLADPGLAKIAPGYTFDKKARSGSFTGPEITTFAAEGDTVFFTYEIENIGSVAIDDPIVTDDKLGNLTCAPTRILPGETATCQETYDITQDDFDAQSTTNVAFANGDPDHGQLGAVEDSVTLTGPAISPAISIVKSPKGATFGAKDSTFTYTFNVTNAGDATLRNVTVTDPLLPGLSCSVATLLPGDDLDCSADYTILQADVDAGSLSNTATVTSIDPNDDDVDASDTALNTGPPQVKGLSMAKTALTADFDAVGDVLSYRFEVTNTGNVTLAGPVTINDPLIANAACPSGDLAPNAVRICTGSYAVTQDDLDALEVENTATASADGATSASSTATVDVVTSLAISMVKQLNGASPTSFDSETDELTYDYVITNNSNISLIAPITVADDKVAVTCPAPTGGKVLPGASITCTSDAYDVQQGDIDAGSVTNTATATATTADGTVDSAAESLTVNAVQTPELTLEKTAPTVAPADFQAGNDITYSYRVTNAGNTTITNQVSITDDKIGTFNCGAVPIAPGAFVDCTQDYEITAQDVANTYINNTATATDGTTTSNADNATVANGGAPALALTKAANPTTFSTLTDTITYTFTVQNTGDVTITFLTPITINDPKVENLNCTQPFLLTNGQTMQCTGTLIEISQAEMDAGEVVNTATAQVTINGATTTSQSATATITDDVTPSIAITKTGPTEFSAVNEDISFTFLVENTGLQTLRNITVSDPLIPGLVCPIADLGPGATDSCTGTYKVKQGDVDVAVINNTATAAGTNDLGEIAQNTGAESVPIDPAAFTETVELRKAADRATFTKAGDLINYSFEVENTGTVTLEDLRVTDPLTGYTCDIATLAPGAINTDCGFTYTVLQSDVNDATRVNTASVVDTTDPAITDSAMVTVDGPAPNPAIAIRKTADVSSFDGTGETITYVIEVENTGNLTLSNVEITDPLFGGGFVCSIGVLEPTDLDNSCTGSITTDQGHVNDGEVENTARVTADDANGGTLDETDTLTVDGPAENGALTVVKFEDDSNGVYADLPTTEDFTITVQNTGNVTLTNIRVTDALLGLDCVIDTLEPTVIATQCTDGTPLSGAYTVVQSDIDAGSLTNTAEASGTTPGGGTALGMAQVVLTGPTQTLELAIDKQITFAGDFDTVGQEVTYDFVVTNTGNITVNSPITVADDLIDGAGGAVSCPALPSGGIAPTESITCSGSYFVTQADIDAGSITNVASASTTTASGDSTTSATDTATVDADQQYSMTLVKRLKDSSATTYSAVNDPITYEYVVTNTGNTTITDQILIDDDKFASDLNCNSPPVAPNGGQIICEQTYAATQQDIDDGSLTNTATAFTGPPGAPTLQSNSDQVTVNAVQTPQLSLVKSTTQDQASDFTNGNVINYTYLVTNEGNTTIEDPISINDNLIDDDLPGLPDVDGNDLNCPAFSPIDPGDTYTCTGTYTIGVNDLALGSTTNVATATDGTTTSPSQSVTIPGGVDPALAVTKAYDDAPDAFTAVGDTLDYTFVVTNSGNGSFVVPITIEDNKIGSITCWTPVAPDDLDFAPGETATCFGSYSVMQDDLDAEQVTNEASAEAIYAPASLNPVPVASPAATVTVDATENPLISVEKVVTPAADFALNDPLNYTITVKNDGNQTISNVMVDDPLVTALSCTLGGATPAQFDLDPNGDDLICTGTLAATQEMVDAGRVDNTATATGGDPQGATVTASGDAFSLAEAPLPAVEITKELVPGPIGATFNDPGESLVYKFTVRNTGNITLNDISVSDSLDAGFSCDVGSLIPDAEDDSCTFTYTTLQSDIDNGGVDNTATVTALPANPGAVEISNTGGEFVPGPAIEPKVTLSKQAQTSDFDTVGDTLSYLFVVANTGNVTVFGTPSVTDDRIGTFDCGVIPPEGLAPGDSVNCTAEDTVDQDDLDAGQVDNTASVGGLQQTDSTAIADSDPVDESITGTQNPSFTLTKDVDATNLSDPDTLTYTITVENTGNISLTAPSLTDVLSRGTDTLTLTSGPTLAGDTDGDDEVDVTEAWVYTATYAVSQDDLDDGRSLVNEATFDVAEAEAQSDDATTTLNQTPAFTLTKDVDVSDLSAPGLLTYEIVVTNTGNLTLTDVSFSDALVQDGGTLALTSGPDLSGDADGDGDLDVGETWTYAATFDAGQDQIDNGADLVNTATFNAEEADEQTADATTTISQAPAFTLSKSVDTDTLNAPGLLTYTITVENTGNVSLTSPDLSDELVQDTATLTLTSGPDLAGDDDSNGEIGVDETWVYTATYDAGQDRIDDGNDIVNTATFNVAEAAEQSADATTTIDQSPAFTLAKVVDETTLSAPDTLTYTITVENTGNVSLTSPDLGDDLVQGARALTLTSGPDLAGDDDSNGEVGVDETWVYTATFDLTQDEIDDGADVVNTATFDVAEADAQSADATTEITQTPSFTLTKSVDTASLDAPGLLTYEIVIENTGNQTLTNVSFADDLVQGAATLTLTSGPDLSGDDDSDGDLDVGETWTYAATFDAGQDQIDDGADIVNTATFSADEAAEQTADATTTIDQTPGMTFVKEVDTATLTAPGLLTYTLTVTNTGNVSLSNPDLSDSLVQGANALTLTSGPDLAGDADGDGDVDLTEVWVYTATYDAGQAQIDDGADIVNSATFDVDEAFAITDDATTQITQSPAFTISKEVDTASLSAPGLLTYTITVENTGNVSLETPVLADDLVQGAATLTLSSGPDLAGDADGDGDLDVTETFVYTATYDVDQDGIDDGGDLVNTATFSADNAAAVADDATTTITQTPAFVLSKVVDVADLSAPGDLTYTITVQNTGNVSLTNIDLSDAIVQGATPLALTSGPSQNGGDTDGDGDIDVGETFAYVATFSATQDQIDDGSDIVNTATFDADEVTADSDAATTTITQTPSLGLDKGLTGTSITAYSAVDDEINYLFTVSNTGNVTITDPITISDPLITDAGGTITCEQGPILVGESLTCEGSYKVTQDNLDAGSVANLATATDGSVTSPSSEELVDAVQTPSMALEKTAREIQPEDYVLGAIVTYDYVVTNDGNVTLATPLTISDNLIAASDITCTEPSTSEIAPTETYECVGTYEVTKEDLELGSTTNVASASDGTTDSPTASETVPAGADPALSVVKSSVDTSFAEVGDELTYSYLVTNTGSASFVTPITIEDDKIGSIACWEPVAGDEDFTPESSDGNVPAQTAICEATYTVTQDDLDAGDVTNEAVANTTYAGSIDVVSPVAEVTIDADADPSLVVTKSAETLPVTTVGQILTYTISVENDGNQTLRNITITDPLIPTLSCTIAELEVDATDASCSGTYEVQQEDVDAGEVVNVASAVGSDPAGGRVENTGTLTVDMPAADPSVELTKVATPSPHGGVDTDVTYWFFVKNTGNVTLRDLKVTDPLIDGFECEIASLAPTREDTTSCSATYRITQDDVDAGGVTNSASVTATDPFGTDVSGSDTITTDGPARAPALRVEKSTSDVPSAADQTLTYVFDVTNDGNVTISNVVLDDPKCAAAPILQSGDTDGDGALDVGDVHRYECTSIGVTQEELDAGRVDNIVTVTGDPAGGVLTDTTDTVETPAEQTPSFVVRKSTDSVPVNEDDSLDYVFEVENTGNVSISGLILTDAKCAAAPALSGGDADSDNPLDVDEIHRFTCTSIGVTQTEIDAGRVDNTVSVTGTPAGGDLTDATDSISTPVPAEPSVEATKTITSSVVGVGETVVFEITVQNTGNVTLNSVGIASDTLTRADDTLLALTTGPSFRSASDGSSEGSLAVGEIATYVATYRLTQEDVDAGGIANTAQATGTPPVGSPVTDITDNGDDGDGNMVDDKTTLEIAPAPSIALAKTLSDTSITAFSAVDDQIDYVFTITNTGNVTLNDAFTVTDPLITDAQGTITCGPPPLAPGDSLICEGSYLVTQEDLDAGEVINSATASDGTSTTDPSERTVEALQDPSLSVEKVARPLAPEDFVVGATATYDYTITNDGNVTITAPVTLDDNLIDAADITCDAFPTGGLVPEATLACVGTYEVTSNDVELGSATNVVTATDGTTTSPSTSETVPAGAEPALTLAKTSAATPFSAVGDVLRYTYTLTNTGNASFVTDVSIEDDKIGTFVCWTAVAGSDPDLTPDETVTCEADYEVTQEDLDAGSVTNEAIARTVYAVTTDVVSPPAEFTVSADAAPAMTVTKSAAVLPVLAVDQILTYTIAVENSGNQTLRNISVTDPLIPDLACTITELDVDASDDSCTGTYQVTQDDIDAGEVVNVATAIGTDPQGNRVTQTGTVTVDMPTPAPALSLVKSATPSPFGAVNSTITYGFAVTNSGNVTLENVTVTDPLIPSFNCVIDRLAPTITDSASCSVIYTVTQADVDRGALENTASVAGTDPFGTPTEITDTITTDGPAAAPALEVTKTAASSGTEVGDTISYRVAVQNTGNVTLDNVVLSDVFVANDGDTIALDAPGLQLQLSSDSNGDGFLDVTETWVYTAQFTLTQEEINASGVTNSVTARATAPDGTPADDTSDNGDDTDGNSVDDPTVVEIVPGPSIEVSKIVQSSTGSDPDDVVTFAFVVDNTGNVDLTSITLVDTLTRADGTPLSLDGAPALSSGDDGDGILQRSETWTYLAEYTLTQEDVDAGGISNSVIASGTSVGGGDPVEDTSDNGDDGDGNTTDDSTDYEVEALPGIEATKTIITAGVAEGDVVEFQITVQNTGNVTLSSVALTDTLTRADSTDLSLDGPVSFVSADDGSDAGTLKPDETATYAAFYTLTLEDVNAGGIRNSANASAVLPSGSSINDTSDDGIDDDGNTVDDPTVMTIEAVPSLEVEKTVSSLRSLFPTIYEVTFAVTVENTGNVTQSNLQVTDDLRVFVAPAVLLSSTYPTTVSISGFTGGSANSAYTGEGVNDTISGVANLDPGQVGTVEITAVFDIANGFPGEENVVSATSDELTTSSVADVEVICEDDDNDDICNAEDLDPTGYFYCEDDGRVLSGGSVAISGNGFTQTGVGVSGPINVVQDGSTGFYQFFVTQAGTYTLTPTYPTSGVVSTARTPRAGPVDVTGLVATFGNPITLGSDVAGGTGVLADFTEAGNPFYLQFDFDLGDPMVQLNNLPMTSCAGTPDILATKNVDKETVLFGDSVTYTLTFTNNTSVTYPAAQMIDRLPAGILYTPNSATVDGVAVEPVISGRQLRWRPFTIAPTQTITVRFAARVAAKAADGKLVNQAWLADNAGTRLSNVATATVIVEPEHVFDCSDVIGKVFDDKNHNGYQDQGEPGLPHVRVVTVRGVRITTDEYGRFHVPCAELPRDIGTNFILKLDERSLPTGYRVTTENPRVIRLTAGKFAKLNFGAAISNVVDIDLTASAFEAGGDVPTDELRAGVANLVRYMANKPSVLRLTYVLRDETRELARDRMDAVDDLIRKSWRTRGRYKLNIERTIKRSNSAGAGE